MTKFSEDKAFIDDVIPTSLLEDAIAWIGTHMSPEDVFSVDDLKIWAENNGYVLEAEN